MSLSSLRYLLATSSCRPPAQLTEYNDMEDYPRETWEWVWASIANVPHLLFLFFPYFSPHVHIRQDGTRRSDEQVHRGSAEGKLSTRSGGKRTKNTTFPPIHSCRSFSITFGVL